MAKRSETGFQQALLELANLPPDADSAARAAASERPLRMPDPGETDQA